MILYKFYHNDKLRAALSTDADGGNLPGEAKDWAFQKDIEISRSDPERVGFPNDQILDAIEKDGYFDTLEHS